MASCNKKRNFRYFCIVSTGKKLHHSVDYFFSLIKFIPHLLEIANFRSKYFKLSKIYTDLGGIKYYNMVCPPVRDITTRYIARGFLIVQADKLWRNYY